MTDGRGRQAGKCRRKRVFCALSRQGDVTVSLPTVASYLYNLCLDCTVMLCNAKSLGSELEQVGRYIL